MPWAGSQGPSCLPGSVTDLLWVPGSSRILLPHLPTENSGGEMGTRKTNPAWHGKPAGDLVMENTALGIPMCILIDFFLFFPQRSPLFASSIFIRMYQHTR